MAREEAATVAVPQERAAARADARVLVLDQVTKRFADVVALDRVDLDVARGELLAIVGPSGCGKSTLLRAIAGLTQIDGGRIVAGSREVAGPRTWVPPERRDVGVVFQDHALFPHLRVANNVAFGLGRRRDRSRVAEVLDLVGLAHLAQRYPHELSGGEQQRVALARALAPRPAVVLLDEPFSNLDRNLRVRIREETVSVLRADGATAVLVTHDQEEALAVGDRVAVARAGRLEQVGPPSTVFHAPTSRFVATFMGEADFVPGRCEGTSVDTAFGQLPVTSSGRGPVEVMLRPHDVALDVDPAGAAVVSRTEFRGAFVLHHLDVDNGSTLRALTLHTAAAAVGTRVTVRPVAGHPLTAFPVTAT